MAVNAIIPVADPGKVLESEATADSFMLAERATELDSGVPLAPGAAKVVLELVMCDSEEAEASWIFRFEGTTSVDCDLVLVFDTAFFFFPVTIMVGDEPAAFLVTVSWWTAGIVAPDLVSKLAASAIVFAAFP